MKPNYFLAILLILTGCKNNNTEENRNHGNGTPASAKIINYSIINSYPHDTSSFTQGLLIYKGIMYEGTGEYGQSRLRRVDIKTGKMEKEVMLEKKYFGEGITILNDTIYQLTWREKAVLVYQLEGFKKIKEFSINTEGWGITTDGKELIVSDGSSNLFYYEPSTFRLLRTQGITEAGSLAFNLNELEYIDGYIYANQWQAPYILKIDPRSGQIVAKADLQPVWNRAKAIDPAADVPNGIAWDNVTKKVYITGKLWPEVYEIQFGH